VAVTSRSPRPRGRHVERHQGRSPAARGRTTSRDTDPATGRGWLQLMAPLLETSTAPWKSTSRVAPSHVRPSFRTSIVRLTAGPPRPGSATEDVTRSSGRPSSGRCGATPAGTAGVPGSASRSGSGSRIESRHSASFTIRVELRFTATSSNKGPASAHLPQHSSGPADPVGPGCHVAWDGASMLVIAGIAHNPKWVMLESWPSMASPPSVDQGPAAGDEARGSAREEEDELALAAHAVWRRPA